MPQKFRLWRVNMFGTHDIRCFNRARNVNGSLKLSAADPYPVEEHERLRC